MMMIIIILLVLLLLLILIFLLFAAQNCAFNGCGDFEFDKLGVDRDKSIDKRSDLEAETMCNQ